jgi:hypothetical protein
MDDGAARVPRPRGTTAEERFDRGGLPLAVADARTVPESALRERAGKVRPGHGGLAHARGTARHQAEAAMGDCCWRHPVAGGRRGLDAGLLAAGPREIVVAASGVDVARDVLRVVHALAHAREAGCARSRSSSPSSSSRSSRARPARRWPQLFRRAATSEPREGAPRALRAA